jgi:type II restriction/modification system DNA methylase subunit YeeA
MMSDLTAKQFVAKWSQIRQSERASAQSHFLDVCRLVGHPPPHEYDPGGERFSFETRTLKADGQKGFADVYFRDHFIWEYKGPHRDLEKAYQQLLLYRDALDNPPLLITSDLSTVHIHTNFTNRPVRKETITFDDLLDGRGVEQLRWAFREPERFMPERTKEQVTRASADTFIAVADAMKQHQRLTGEAYTPEQLAHFLVRLLFCLFAEDLGLLPEAVFTQIVKVQGGAAYADLTHALRNLFRAMRSGDAFGFYRVPWFNGTLFDDDFVPTIPHDLSRAILCAAEQDWSAVDPSIFGTLFERVIDAEKRAQLGAHYTSQEDILLIVEPVLMEPLRRRWDEVRREVDGLLRRPVALGTTALGTTDGNRLPVIGEQSPTDNGLAITAYQLLADFAAEIAAIRVLDPACGSGNFLYVALRRLLDLQKEVIAYAGRKELPLISLTVSPEQLYGIEINPYAHELAQVTAWIGYLQWRHENGFAEMAEPILKPLNNIRQMDAILAYDENGRPVEPEWPAAEVIIGNPPFLGAKQMIGELTEDYVNKIRKVYEGRLPGFSDLVTYWFERSRREIEKERSRRAGLLATNSIRMGTNLKVLENIKNTGDIFLAWADRDWILEGAAVRVSIIGFDNGTEKYRVLDGKLVSEINADLTALINLTKATQLIENANIAFIGTQRSGPFDLSGTVAQAMLESHNKSGLANSDVVKPQFNSKDVIEGSRNVWVIDFDLMTEKEAARYEMPFEYVKQHVYPVRSVARRKAHAARWWQLAETRQGMKKAIAGKGRYIATPIHAKHRLFVWLDSYILPDHALTAIARDDDYFLGILQSKPHELWALRLGTSLEDRPRYTPTTSFQTFPFPWPPGQEPTEAEDPRVAAIAHWARELVAWRDAWLNPPRPPSNVIDVAYQRMLKDRTLTNLYNGLVYYRETAKQGKFFDAAEFGKVTRNSVTREEIVELDDIHVALDAAVLEAYGWPQSLRDDEILERLLGLNLERAAG